MKVLVCRGRDYYAQAVVDYALDTLNASRRTLVIHGAQDGADTLADNWAKSRGIKRKPFPAYWNALDKNGVRLGPRAGPLRNQRMIDEGGPVLVVAFPGGTGTADMMRRAERAKVRVWDVVNQPMPSDGATLAER